jgi:hypothetical protein
LRGLRSHIPGGSTSCCTQRRNDRPDIKVWRRSPGLPGSQLGGRGAPQANREPIGGGCRKSKSRQSPQHRPRRNDSTIYLTMDRTTGQTACSRRYYAIGHGRRDIRFGAAEFLELARCALLPAVRKRYMTIAQHYRTLAETEKRAQIKKNQATPHGPRSK